MASPRILIVRLSAIGDVIQGMPIACALRERFPEAFLAWAVESSGGSLLQGHEALDQVISLPHGWLRSPRGVWRVRRLLRRLRFDIAIDAQGLTKSAMLAWFSAAPRRIGYGNPWGRELSRWFNTETVDTLGPHIIDRNLQLLQPLGIESPTVQFRVPECPSDGETAVGILHELGLEHRFAMINPGAGWPSKIWPAQRFAAVAARLGRESNLPSLIVQGRSADELAMAQQIVGRSEGYAKLSPKVTLPELAAIARRATLFIGSDTGPLHLAAAVDTPCIGLYGPWPFEVHGPRGPQHIMIQKARFAGTTRERRTAPPQIMEAITVDDVCEACSRILTATRERACGNADVCEEGQSAAPLPSRREPLQQEVDWASPQRPVAPA